jgi:hypothetical protein
MRPVCTFHSRDRHAFPSLEHIGSGIKKTFRNSEFGRPDPRFDGFVMPIGLRLRAGYQTPGNTNSARKPPIGALPRARLPP